MIEFVALIMAAPVGVLEPSTLQNVVYAALLVSDCEECGFNDLGKLLFGGLILAIVVGIAISLLHRRVKDKSKWTSEFVSIQSNDRKQ